MPHEHLMFLFKRLAIFQLTIEEIMIIQHCSTHTQRKNPRAIKNYGVFRRELKKLNFALNAV